MLSRVEHEKSFITSGQADCRKKDFKLSKFLYRVDPSKTCWGLILKSVKIKQKL